MSKKAQISPKPPRWATRLLLWYCKPSLYEDLQGDLHEYFDRNVEERGAAYAKLIYGIDVLKFFRPYTVQKPQILKGMNHFTMFRNYFKTSVRSMARDKSFASINIIGLAISMSLTMVLIVFLAELNSRDSFHKNRDRIYRVISDYSGAFKGKTDTLQVAGASVYLGKELSHTAAGVEELVMLKQGHSFDIKHNDNELPLKGCFASASFFNVFSFPVQRGNPETALLDPNSILLTASAAKKLFKEQDPFGQIVTLTNHQSTESYMVTGILEDPPANSSLQFEFLISFSTWEKMEEEKLHSRLMDWDNIWTTQVYLLLAENASLYDLQLEMDRISRNENARDQSTSIFMTLQALGSSYLGTQLFNDKNSVIEKKHLVALTVFVLIVLASACFNYTNLSLAKSLRRSKEVGIRKVIGASQNQLITQFLTEAVVLTLIAAILAFGFFLLMRPAFLELPFSTLGAFGLKLEPLHILYFVSVAISTGIIIGFFPAVILAKARSGAILKGVGKKGSLSIFSIKNSLTVAQFAISMGFIIGATVTYKQYQYAMGFDHGFSTESILNVELNNVNSDVLAAEVAKIPEVISMSRSALVLGTGRNWGDNVKYRDPHDSSSFYYNYVDRNYLSQHDFKLLAGDFFSSELSSGEREKHIIINERMLRRLNIGTPEGAIGEVIEVNGDLKLQVVGVVSDFHHGTLKEEVLPFAFRQNPLDHKYLNVKVETTDLPATLDKLANAWNKIDPVHPFVASFFDAHLEKAYSGYQAMFKIIGYVAFFAISISALGLIGMAVLVTEGRLKEVCVRKVLGANEGNLVYWLSRGFVFIFLVAGALAIPMSYFLLEKLFLSEFAYRVNIGFIELFTGVGSVFLIGGLIVATLTLKAARTNPAHILRNE